MIIHEEIVQINENKVLVITTFDDGSVVITEQENNNGI